MHHNNTKSQLSLGTLRIPVTQALKQSALKNHVSNIEKNCIKPSVIIQKHINLQIIFTWQVLTAGHKIVVVVFLNKY